MDERRLNRCLYAYLVRRLGGEQLFRNLLLICVNLRNLRIELRFLGLFKDALIYYDWIPNDRLHVVHRDFARAPDLNCDRNVTCVLQRFTGQHRAGNMT
jgi:hypothetical protein